MPQGVQVQVLSPAFFPLAVFKQLIYDFAYMESWHIVLVVLVLAFVVVVVWRRKSPGKHVIDLTKGTIETTTEVAPPDIAVGKVVSDAGHIKITSNPGNTIKVDDAKAHKDVDVHQQAPPKKRNPRRYAFERRGESFRRQRK